MQEEGSGEPWWQDGGTELLEDARSDWTKEILLMWRITYKQEEAVNMNLIR